MSIDHVVVDVEIQKCIEDVPGGWNATDKLGVACACVWEYQTQRMRVYGPDDVEALRERLLKADRITGYNIWRFDFPVIWGFPDRGRYGEGNEFLLKILPKTNDLLKRIWEANGLDSDALAFGHGHRGWSLDNVARATLNNWKIGNGADAPKWFQAGQFARVINYCCDDVCLERDLSDFIDKNGYVLNWIQGELVKVTLCDGPKRTHGG